MLQFATQSEETMSEVLDTCREDGVEKFLGA
jgi:hypothetical protein